MIGAYTHKELTTYLNNSGQITSVTRTTTGDAEYNVTAPLAANTVNQEMDLVFALPANAGASGLQSLCILNGAGGPVTILTNSTGAPGDTKVLAPGQTLIWNNQHPEPCPFSASVTKLFLSTGAAASVLTIAVLTNI